MVFNHLMALGWSETGRGSLCGFPGSRESQPGPFHKSSSSVIGSLFYYAKLFCFFVIMWDEQSTLLSDANQRKDLIPESLVAENSYALMFPMTEIQAN